MILKYSKENYAKNFTGIEKIAVWKFYFSNWKGDNLRTTQIQTSLVVLFKF